MSRRNRRSRLLVKWSCLIGLTITLAIPSLTKANIVVQNDSIGAAGAGTPLPQFLPNEQAVAWLTTPVTGDIVGVQVFWDSLFGTNPPQTELALHIYGGGTFPTPGPLLATVNLPTLNDRALNQFNFLDPPTNSMPIQVPVTSGQTFAVGIEFLNQSAGFPSATMPWTVSLRLIVLRSIGIGCRATPSGRGMPC